MPDVNRPASERKTLMSFGGGGNLFQRSWKTGIWNDNNFYFIFYLFFLVWHILRASEWNWCLFTFFIVLGRFSLFRKMLWSAYQNKKLAANWRRWLVQSAAGRQKYWQSFRALAVSEWRVDRASFCLWVKQLTQTYLSKGPVIPSTFAKTVGICDSRGS